jgi:hypothetical protein
MCNSCGPTWAINCLSVLLRAMQGRIDNCKTAIQLHDEEEISLLFRDSCMLGDRVIGFMN